MHACRQATARVALPPAISLYCGAHALSPHSMAALRSAFDDFFCEICTADSAEDEKNVVMCDHCARGYHISCLSPPLAAVPEGDWFCPLCPAPGRVFGHIVWHKHKRSYAVSTCLPLNSTTLKLSPVSSDARVKVLHRWCWNSWSSRLWKPTTVWKPAPRQAGSTMP